MTFGQIMFKIEVYKYHFLAKLIHNATEVTFMKSKKLFWVIGIISFVAALSAAVTAFLFVKDKQKKDDEELMEYLDSAIE